MHWFTEDIVLLFFTTSIGTWYFLVKLWMMWFRTGGCHGRLHDWKEESDRSCSLVCIISQLFVHIFTYAGMSECFLFVFRLLFFTSLSFWMQWSLFELYGIDLKPILFFRTQKYIMASAILFSRRFCIIGSSLVSCSMLSPCSRPNFNQSELRVLGFLVDSCCFPSVFVMRNIKRFMAGY